VELAAEWWLLLNPECVRGSTPVSVSISNFPLEAPGSAFAKATADRVNSPFSGMRCTVSTLFFVFWGSCVGSCQFGWSLGVVHSFAKLLECVRVLAPLFVMFHDGCLKIVRHGELIGLEGIHRLPKCRSRIGFKPGCRTPWILIRQRNQPVFHRVLMDIVQSCEPRFLKR
jgi:hypothetical protein